jgi:hypothetical protein
VEDGEREGREVVLRRVEDGAHLQRGQAVAAGELAQELAQLGAGVRERARAP